MDNSAAERGRGSSMELRWPCLPGGGEAAGVAVEDALAAAGIQAAAAQDAAAALAAVGAGQGGAVPIPKKSVCCV